MGPGDGERRPGQGGAHDAAGFNGYVASRISDPADSAPAGAP